MPWFKVDDMLHAHPKARKAGLEAMGLWALAGSYCSAYKLDGHVDSDWIEGQKRGRTLANRLVSAGLWHESGHQCEGCPQPNEPRGFIFHDWADSNPTADEVEAKRASDRERQRTRRARLTAPATTTPLDVTPDVTRDSQRTSGVSHGTPSLPDPSLTSSSELRPDVAELLDHLDRCIVANGAKKPNRTKGNADAARLLIDRDGRPLDEAHRLIDWATSDPFWRSNILSMVKFRERYDQLRIKAQGSTLRRPTSDGWMNR